MENQIENYEVIPNINYSVYNALNLACEDLGQQYIQTGFNPFEPGFELDEIYITDALSNNKNAPELKTPEFIEKGDKATLQAFSNSLTNCESLLAEIQGKLNSPELTPEQKAKLQKIITYLKMRIELLSIYIKDFKNKKNKLMLYKHLLALNYAYGELLEDSFSQEFSAHNIANQLLFIQQNTSQTHKSSLIEKAKQIIADNLKKQELANQSIQQVEKSPEVNAQPTEHKYANKPEKKAYTPQTKDIDIER